MKYFDVFKAGKYPQGVFSSQDVETLALNYDPKFCEAPVTLDHEQKGPAYGWVSGLKSENGKLKASFRDVTDELKEFVQSGKYKKISVEIYKELEGKKPYLKAVSFLGASIPQVKGMDPVEFKEGESEIYVFELEDIKLEDKTGIKPNQELIKLQEQISELETQIKLFVKQPDKNENDAPVLKLQEKVQALSAQIAKMQDDSVARQNAENELVKLKQKIKNDEFELFLNSEISEGRLIPAQKELCSKILTALDNVKQFSEEDFTEEFKQFIKSLPKQVEFKEIATKKKSKNSEDEFLDFADADEESLLIYKEAKQLSEKEKIPFKDAVLKIHE